MPIVCFDDIEPLQAEGAIVRENDGHFRRGNYQVPDNPDPLWCLLGPTSSLLVPNGLCRQNGFEGEDKIIDIDGLERRDQDSAADDRLLRRRRKYFQAPRVR